MKIILKKNVKGNEQMVYDELALLQKLKHPHIVAFKDWFESRVSDFRSHWGGRICYMGANTGGSRRRTNTTLSLN